MSLAGCGKVVADVQMIGGGSASLVLMDGEEVVFDAEIPGVSMGELDFATLGHDNTFDQDPKHAECSGSYAVLTSDTFAPGSGEPSYSQFAELRVYLCRESLSQALAEQGVVTTEARPLHLGLLREYRLCANNRLEGDGIAADANADSLSTVDAAFHGDGGGVGSQPCGVATDEWVEGEASGVMDWWSTEPDWTAEPIVAADTTLSYTLSWSFDPSTVVSQTVDFTATPSPY